MIGNPNYQMPDNDIRNHLLDDLAALFAKSGSNIHNFNLPHRTNASGSSSTNRLVEEELAYDVFHLISQTYYHRSTMSKLLPSIL